MLTQDNQKVIGNGRKSHVVMTDYSSLDNPQCIREVIRRNVGRDFAMPITPASPQLYSIPLQFGNYVSTRNNPSLPMNSDATKISHLSSQLTCLNSTSAAASCNHVSQTLSTVHAPYQKKACQELISNRDILLRNFQSKNSSSSLTKKHIIGLFLLQSPTVTWCISLPGYEALDRAHTILQGHSNNELAFHMTRADAVCFLLASRPA